MNRSRLPARHRLIASAAGLVLAISGIAIAAPSASAAPAPRTFTTSMTPTAAVPGASVSYAVVVTNTSTKVSAMDRYILQIPTGYTVSPGTVTSPRGSWTETVSAGQLVASTPTPVQNGLRKGEAITVRFTAVDTVACDTRLAAWVQKADGKVIDPWIAQSPNPTVQGTPVADRFVVTSVEDGNPATLGNQVLKNQGFDVTGAFRCGESLSAPAGAAGTVALGKTVASQAGGLAGTTSAVVAATDTTKTVSGATYDTVINALGLTADWSGGADGSTTVDVLGAAALSNGSVNSVLTIPEATITLTNGGGGPVALVIQACDTSESTCSDGTEVSLSGSFKDSSHNPLYGFGAPRVNAGVPLPTDLLAPARITRVCEATDCPHQDPLDSGPEGEGGQSSYTYNFLCSGNSCSGEGSTFGEREVEEDYSWHDTYVSLRKSDGSYTAFALAPRCVPLPTSWNDPQKSALLSSTRVGKIETVEGQNLGFCVDVNGITRDGDLFTGALHIPILFVEDPRVRP